MSFDGFILKLLLISSKVATRWEPWGRWLECRFQDGTDAKCWKDVKDPPQQKRRQFCVKERSGKEEVCNEEYRTCTELPTCSFGELYWFLPAQVQILPIYRVLLPISFNGTYLILQIWANHNQKYFDCLLSKKITLETKHSFVLNIDFHCDGETFCMLSKKSITLSRRNIRKKEMRLDNLRHSI